MKLGPVMVDVEGLELSRDDVRRLEHPRAGGVILFARNFASPFQLLELVSAIRERREPQLLIAVDHEGGRVQRFAKGFTRIPPMREIGRLWDRDPVQAHKAARACGLAIGAELQAHGVDFSFAPVLDVDYGESGVIGDRAFHRDPEAIASLAQAFHLGLQATGANSVGKHFPGHGYVRADSHHEVPVDDRPLEEIMAADLLPFRKLARAGMGGVMPAHVIYPQVDAKPAGFSKTWLQSILRRKLGFEGLVFSDDLSMEGARTAGGVVQRAEAALEAGCDMVLLCNAPRDLDRLLDGLAGRPIAASLAPRLERMRGRAITDESLKASLAYIAATESIAKLGAQ